MIGLCLLLFPLRCSHVYHRPKLPTILDEQSANHLLSPPPLPCVTPPFTISFSFPLHSLMTVCLFSLTIRYLLPCLPRALQPGPNTTLNITDSTEWPLTTMLTVSLSLSLPSSIFLSHFPFLLSLSPASPFICSPGYHHSGCHLSSSLTPLYYVILWLQHHPSPSPPLPPHVLHPSAILQSTRFNSPFYFPHSLIHFYFQHFKFLPISASYLW